MKVCALTGKESDALVEVAIPDLRLKTATTLLSREALDGLSQYIFAQRGRTDARKLVADRKQEEAEGKKAESPVLLQSTPEELVLVASGKCPKCRAIIRGFRAIGEAQRELYDTLKANGINPLTGHTLGCGYQTFRIQARAVVRPSPVHELQSGGEALLKRMPAS